MLTGTMVSVSSCSNDDEEESKKKEELDIDNEPAQDFEGLSINFQLLNSDSVAMKSFKEGEDIILKLTISNSRNETAILPRISLLVEDLFHVYSSESKDYGRPWDSYVDPATGVWMIYPNESLVFYCFWDGKVDSDSPYSNDIEKSVFILRKTETHSRLVKGRYYSQFDLPIDTKGKKITCKKQFEIK